ncbi:hypothetical protein MRB53_040521 [Persea americana]|nr:hypothetical protein MRB53_040521 [Persea americana]
MNSEGGLSSSLPLLASELSFHKLACVSDKYASKQIFAISGKNQLLVDTLERIVVLQHSDVGRSEGSLLRLWNLSRSITIGKEVSK